MKNQILIIMLGVAVVLGFAILQSGTKAAEGSGFQKYEFVTIRWAGRDNTHLIRSNGRVEMLGSLLKKVPRPDRVDDRTFYMSIAMNAVAKEGYEFAGMTNDEVVMKRALQP